MVHEIMRERKGLKDLMTDNEMVNHTATVCSTHNNKPDVDQGSHVVLIGSAQAKSQ